MEKRPSISVIIPVYNGVLFLEETVHSILNQSHRDFELLLINDGSTDDSLDMLHRFSDPRIRIVDQENMGLVGTLNKGFQMATADIVARLDQDDISEPHRLAHQLKQMHYHQVGNMLAYVYHAPYNMILNHLDLNPFLHEILLD